MRIATVLIAVLLATFTAGQERPTMSAVLAASSPSDWRRPDPGNTLYLQLPGGRVVIELAPDFAPNHVANIRKLVADGYFDGLAVVRSQENYVAQWGDPNAGTAEARGFGDAADSLLPEFYRSAEGLAFTPIDSRDAYASEVGFSNGFPAGRDGVAGRAWLVHCFGMLGVGRGNKPDSGSGAELYVVTGHAPRHLDRNVTLVGRVLDGIEHLTTLPRGSGPLGFYETAAERVPVASMRLASDVPGNERLDIQLLRTDTETFAALVEARRHRAEEWFVDPSDAVGICNVPLPSRIPAD